MKLLRRHCGEAHILDCFIMEYLCIYKRLVHNKWNTLVPSFVGPYQGWICSTQLVRHVDPVHKFLVYEMDWGWWNFPLPIMDFPMMQYPRIRGLWICCHCKHEHHVRVSPTQARHLTMPVHANDQPASVYIVLFLLQIPWQAPPVWVYCTACPSSSN
jgi:hypothetical protein